MLVIKVTLAVQLKSTITLKSICGKQLLKPLKNYLDHDFMPLYQAVSVFNLGPRS